METQGYSCDVHTKIRERTQRVFVWHSHKKVGQFHSEKEAKRSADPHKRVMYEIKGNNGEVYS